MKTKTKTIECKPWNGKMTDRMREKYDTACEMCGRPMRTFHSSGIYVRIVGRVLDPNSGLDSALTLADLSGPEWDDAERVNEYMTCIGSACAKKVPADYKWETTKRI
jgi:hypothetical protein